MVSYADLAVLLASGKWNKTMAQLLADPALGPAVWTDGDFTGEQLVTYDDIAAMLATGLIVTRESLTVVDNLQLAAEELGWLDEFEQMIAQQRSAEAEKTETYAIDPLLI